MRSERRRKRTALRSAMAAGVGALAFFGLGASGAAAAPATNGIPGWGYELVSPVSTAGQESFPMSISPAGDDVVYASPGGFADVDALSNLGIPYRARRTPSGWQTATLGNPPVTALRGFTFGSVDYEAEWWLKDAPLVSIYGGATKPTIELDTPLTVFQGTKGGAWQPLPFEAKDLILYGTSPDQSMLLLQSREALPVPLTDGSVDTRTYGASSTTRGLLIVKRNPDGTFDYGQVAQQNGESFRPSCEIVLAGRGNPVRRGALARKDFSRVVFAVAGSGCTNTASTRVWATDPFSEDADAIELSAPEPGCVSCTNQNVTMVGGAADVSRVYMTTTQKLLNVDTQSGTDLYEYDYRQPAGQRLRLVTGNSTPANVQGVQDVSEDGSRVFFVANGVLDDAVYDDVEPSAAGRNLYLRMDDPEDPVNGTPIVRFIATLDAGDQVATAPSRLGTITPDGRYFTFMSKAALTDDKLAGDTTADIYRYDVETGELIRIWTDDPDHNGANRTGTVSHSGISKSGQYANFDWQWSGRGGMTDDGSTIMFWTDAALAPGDLNGAGDIYLWREETGTIAMVSDGKDPLGAGGAMLAADGTTVLVLTRTRLVPQHTSTSQGMYAYRLGGGIPLPPAPPTPCQGDECQDQTSAPDGPRLASVEFAGAGNLKGGDRVDPSVSVSKAKVVVGSAGRIAVRVPAAGRIAVRGAAVRGASRAASKGGRYSLPVKLSANARKALAKRGALSVRVRVSYRARGGRLASKTVVVKFKRPAAKPWSIRKGGK